MTELFVTCTAPHWATTTTTLGRWIKEVLLPSGIDPLFSTHNTPHASTSAAKRRGIPIDVICQSAGWTSTSNAFERFYDRSIIFDPTSFAPSFFLIKLLKVVSFKNKLFS